MQVKRQILVERHWCSESRKINGYRAIGIEWSKKVGSEKGWHVAEIAAATHVKDAVRLLRNIAGFAEAPVLRKFAEPA